MSLNSILQINGNVISDAAYRANVIAQNIANVNTPGYTSRYLYPQNGFYSVDIELPFPEGQAFDGTISDADIREMSVSDMILKETLNNVDPAREFTHLIATEHVLEANAKVITAADMMYGVVVNMRA